MILLSQISCHESLRWVSHGRRDLGQKTTMLADGLAQPMPCLYVCVTLSADLTLAQIKVN